MVAKEALQVEENTDMSQDLYEEEETLSLCDLPTHNDSSKWDVKSSWLDNDENDDGFFEFFSEDFTASTYPFSGKDIIFCGKLIPYKEVTPLLPQDDHQKIQNDLESNNKKVPTKKGFRLWKSYSFHKLVRSSSWNSKGSKIGKNSNSKPKQAVKANSMDNNCAYNTRKITSHHHHHHRHRHVSVGKVSVLSSPAKSSKWYLYMFGIARLPMEMELRDIKSRQSRRRPSTMFASSEKISTEMGKEKATRRRSGKGLWGFLRTLGCRSTSQHPTDVVKGSSGCNIPQLYES